MATARVERHYGRVPFWRRARRILLLAAIACLVPTAVSCVGTMTTGKHNVSLGVSSVEWLRQNGGNSLVSEIENWYYSLTAPSKGGPPLSALPQVGVGARAKKARPGRQGLPARPT